MTDKQLKAVLDHVEDSGLLKWRAGPYLDSFASIYEENDVWYITSQVYARKPLLDVRFIDLTFYKEVKLKVTPPEPEYPDEERHRFDDFLHEGE